MKPITVSDRKSLIRLASALPKGSEDRRAILGFIKSGSGDLLKELAKDLGGRIEDGEMRGVTQRQLSTKAKKKGWVFKNNKNSTFTLSKGGSEMTLSMPVPVGFLDALAESPGDKAKLQKKYDIPRFRVQG
tara:strand:- start:954 stop:1346 length:393 start_codon:yes stop_codon:yes gene_type:complete